MDKTELTFPVFVYLLCYTPIAGAALIYFVYTVITRYQKYQELKDRESANMAAIFYTYGVRVVKYKSRCKARSYVKYLYRIDHPHFSKVRYTQLSQVKGALKRWAEGGRKL